MRVSGRPPISTPEHGYVTPNQPRTCWKVSPSGDAGVEQQDACRSGFTGVALRIPLEERGELGPVVEARVAVEQRLSSSQACVVQPGFMRVSRDAGAT